MEKIEIAVVVKPQGIKGEIKLKPFVDGFDSVSKIKTVYIDDIAYRILNLRNAGDGFVVMLEGISDRNMAENFRGKTVYALKNAIKKPENAYFISDIIGCTLFLNSGKKIGEITDIKTTSVDIFTVITENEGTCYFPFIKDLHSNVNLQNKTVTVDAKRFTEVVLYES